MTSPRCAVGLLTWNGERDVLRCVESVLNQRETPLEIHWVDNASADRTVESVIRQFPSFQRPVVNPRNVGFCAGHNQMFRASRAPYYLALNQDAVLAPDYVARLCDWMESDPQLALASGLILWDDGTLNPNGRIYSAGMAMGYGRFPFELRRDAEPKDSDRVRRIVPAVTGAAMIVRGSAIEAISDRPGELFPPEFFAYFEEVDLALRAARGGFKCGVEGSALAWHAERGQGGAANPEIRLHYFKNHWLMSLRNDSFRDLFLESPYISKGELKHYLLAYLRQPLVAFRALARTLALSGWARRSYREFSARHPGGEARRQEFYERSREELRK